MLATETKIIERPNLNFFFIFKNISILILAFLNNFLTENFYSKNSFGREV